MLSLGLIPLLCTLTTGFVIRNNNAILPRISFRDRTLFSRGGHNVETGVTNSSPESPLNRKGAITIVKTCFALAFTQGIIPRLVNLPSYATEDVVNKPVVVIGSGGKTGTLIIDNLLMLGAIVKPSYRGSPPKVTEQSPYLKDAAFIDVTKVETIEGAISGASAVIFAASASKNGGTAEQVDYIGVANVARECVRLKIPRLVVISSGAITKPNSLGFKITNLFGRIMEWKLKGEDELRAIYDVADDPSLSYAIIRPGGLVDGSAEGPSKIELNQGDTISGEINRADVAACAAATATSKALIGKRVTFEVYEKATKGPLEGKYSKVSGYESDGDTYEKLFSGLKASYVL